MRRYRLFVVDPLRRVDEERVFEALNDEEARRLAAAMRESRPAELWATHHRIARWN